MSRTLNVIQVLFTESCTIWTTKTLIEFSFFLFPFSLPLCADELSRELFLIYYRCQLLILCFNRLLDTYLLLLKQNLQRMNVWLNMAESRIKAQGAIGPGYDDLKRQLEDHQVSRGVFTLIYYQRKVARLDFLGLILPTFEH